MEWIMATVSYLRVSTADQDNGKFKAQVLDFANTRNLGQVEFVCEEVSGKVPWEKRKIGEIIAKLGKGDNLIVPELSRLSRSLKDVLLILEASAEKEISMGSLDTKKDGYYDEIHKRLMNNDKSLYSQYLEDGKVTVKELGGWECAKCHY